MSAKACSSYLIMYDVAAAKYLGLARLGQAHHASCLVVRGLGHVVAVVQVVAAVDECIEQRCHLRIT